MITIAAERGRRLLVPEVVQTSAMDCGPASLKCLLEGFGISASYGRLREACQTDVDGTSIDTMEDIAIQLGLDAEQVMVPVDHLLLPEAQSLPAIVVVRRSDGSTHFVVLWRRHGRVVQVMDPAAGRRWPTCAQFLEEIYVHVTAISAAAWREWAGSNEFAGALRSRLAALGLARSAGEQAIAAALADRGWRSLAALDAAARMAGALVRSGSIRRGRQAERIVAAFCERARSDGPDAAGAIREIYWSVRPAQPDPDGQEQLLLRGAVLVRARRRPRDDQASGDTGPALSPELVAALEEPPSRPGRELLGLLRADGLRAPIALAAALALAAGTVIVEAMLFRGLLDIGRALALTEQRLWAIGALLVFILALLFLEGLIATGLLRLGRHLEARLRIAFLEKIPRLSDRYFQSRPASDMAERSHSLHLLRLLPGLGGQIVRAVMNLVVTFAALAWLDPAGAPIAALVALLAVILPLIAQPLLAERNLRVRTHTGALSRFYLDAMLGLLALRTHRAERAVRREHESLLVEWARASVRLQRAALAVEGVQSFAAVGLTAWLLLDYLARVDAGGGALLFVYWALSLPALGQELAQLMRQYPPARSIALRLLEPLGAREEIAAWERDSAAAPARHSAAERSGGVAITMEGVCVQAAGHTILEGIDLTVTAGSQVAVVGSSGAGKSSLVGLLLGWHRPAAGRVLVDGQPLDSRRLDQLRLATAWVDPAVQLWNRAFLDNLRYGAPDDRALPVSQIIDQADLRRVLEQLPEGLQTPLGEGGGLVSGGEGQRVRLGRALLRPGVRLAILDEPFRGLDRERRRALLERARRLWQGATLFCVTHDVEETRSFARVLVVEGGRIVEDGDPAELAARPGSRYRALLEAEELVRERLCSGDVWRRLRLTGGRVEELEIRD